MRDQGKVGLVARRRLALRGGIGLGLVISESVFGAQGFQSSIAGSEMMNDAL